MGDCGRWCKEVYELAYFLRGRPLNATGLQRRAGRALLLEPLSLGASLLGTECTEWHRAERESERGLNRGGRREGDTERHGEICADMGRSRTCSAARRVASSIFRRAVWAGVGALSRPILTNRASSPAST